MSLDEVTEDFSRCADSLKSELLEIGKRPGKKEADHVLGHSEVVKSARGPPGSLDSHPVEPKP